MIGVYDEQLRAAGAHAGNLADLHAAGRARAAAIFEDLAACQKAPVLDDSPRVSVLCPRRAGKTFMTAATALITGEANPGSITLIISLTLKSLRRNYWLGSRSGLQFLSNKYGLGLEFNSSELRWTHQNGSMGYLLGAEDRAQMEYIRGIEADLYVVDECKSFHPEILSELIDDIILPQRISRVGRLMLIGTPGSIFAGPFYQATCRDSRTEPTADAPRGMPWLVGQDEDDIFGRPRRHLWSFHHWTLEQNDKMPHQWAEALDLKAMKGWGSDHPTWRREYLGEWTTSQEGLVYRYGDFKDRCTWRPEYTDQNPTGLDPSDGPWHLVMGLDVGYEDPTALVVAAWSESRGELRQIWEEKRSHLLIPDMIALVQDAIARFGYPEVISVDTGGSMAKNFAETLSQRYGLPIQAADKHRKFEFIELLNGDFSMGRVKIIPGSHLEKQLESVQFDLSDSSKEDLAHRGKLREDPACPNDVTDAFLYLWRECHHHFSKAAATGPEPGSVEWWQARERAAYLAACRQHQLDKTGRDRGLTRESLPFGTSPVPQPWRVP